MADRYPYGDGGSSRSGSGGGSRGSHYYDPRNSGQGGGSSYYGPDRGRSTDRAEGNARGDDRSRSRDNTRGGGGGRFHDGRGGGGGRGRGSKGALVSRRPQLERNGVQVLANCFRITFLNRGLNKWYMYKVNVQEVQKKRDKAGNLIKDDEGRPIYEPKANNRSIFSVRPGDETDESFSTVKSRRVLKKCHDICNNLGWFFITDGTDCVYSPIEKPLSLSEPILVTVKRDCEDHDIDADRSEKYNHNHVSFTPVQSIEFHVDRNRVYNSSSSTLTNIAQVTNIALNHSMLESQMIGFGRSPKLFFWPIQYQTRALLGDIADRGEDNHPILGLSQDAYFAKDGTLQMLARVQPRWVRREMDRSGQRIPVLKPDVNGNGGFLIGANSRVRIDNLNDRIPPEKQLEVEKLFRGLKFHIGYECGPQWEKLLSEDRKKRGRSNEEIQQEIANKKKKWVPNKKLWKGGSDGSYVGSILFDPSSHEFEDKKSRKNVTVEQYFLKRYDVKFRYPFMPLVRISKDEYFPIEFLFQAFDEVKGANSDQQKESMLRFHDNFSCRGGIEQIEKLMGDISLGLTENQEATLSQLGLRCEKKSLRVTAKVLEEPNIQFSESSRATDVSNGSWNLQAKIFRRPADISSFAVVDFVGGTAAEDVVDNVLAACTRHGMTCGPYVTKSTVQSVLYHSNMTGIDSDLKEAVVGAVAKAKSFFFDNKARVFKHGIRFVTTIRLPGRLLRCAVIPKEEIVSLPETDQREIDAFVVMRDGCMGIILRPETLGASHRIQLQGSEEKLDVRLMYQVGDDIIDPFRLRQHGNGMVSVDGAGFYTHTDLDEYFVDESGQNRLRCDDERIMSVEPFFTLPNRLESWIECPSVVFLILPAKDTRIYHYLKFLLTFGYGIQSQVLVYEQYKKQRKGVESYCSGVAAKINTKLSNSLNAASAWELSPKYGHSWLDDLPTLVIGITTCSGQGKDARMVVVGTGMLESGGLRMCHEAVIEKKNSVISSESISAIVKSLVLHFVSLYSLPQRLLILRSGTHDGLFEEILNKEVPAVRSGFALASHELVGTKDFIPPITYIVAQDDHGVKIALDGEEWDSSTNVPSGTCVDDGELVKSCLASNVDTQDDFFMISQGGLKGTSKAVYYRMLLNENDQGERPLTKAELQKILYGMSFQYGTATRAPRLASVLQYSSRLANLIMGSEEYMFQHQKIGNISYDPFIPELKDNQYCKHNGQCSALSSSFLPQDDQKVHGPPLHPHTAC